MAFKMPQEFGTTSLDINTPSPSPLFEPVVLILCSSYLVSDNNNNNQVPMLLSGGSRGETF